MFAAKTDQGDDTVPAFSIQQGVWCSAPWQKAIGRVKLPDGNRIFCCNAGSYIKDLDARTIEGRIVTKEAVSGYEGGTSRAEYKNIYVVNSDDCPNCPIGQYTAGFNMNKACTPASRDTFVPAEGLTFSSACATNTFSNPPNSSSCTLCPAGKQMVRGAMTTTCEDCGVGTFQKHPGTEYCDDCVTGFYQDETGIPYCVGCIPGMYQGKEGEANCTTCPNGWSTTDNSVQEGGAPLVDECQRCQRGKSTNLKRGAAECVTCALGSYGLVAEYNCVLCPVGT